MAVCVGKVLLLTAQLLYCWPKIQICQVLKNITNILVDLVLPGSKTV